MRNHYVIDPQSTIQFVKVICKDCKAEHVVFTCATTRIRCPECGIIQIIPKGGKCKLINCTKVEDTR